MKRFTFLIFLFMSFQLQAQWSEKDSGVTADLWDVCFVDSLNGWIVGSNSTLLRTNNGGDDWEIIQLGYETDQNTKINFIDELNGFLLTKGVLYTTVTGGNSWEKIYNGELVITSFFFADLNKGWITMIDKVDNFTKSYIMRTTNRGIEWQQQFADSSIERLSFLSVYFNDTLGVASGFKEPGIDNVNTHILITLDEGYNWNRADSLTHLSDKIIIINNTIVTGGVGLDISEDYGSSWVHNFDFSWVKDFSNSKNPLWLINSHPTYGHNISYSYNSENNWSNINLPNNLFYNGLDAYNDKYVWLVGISGKVLEYSKDITSVSYNEQMIPGNIILLNNYPNPFNPITKISFTLATKDNIKLKVFDILGREVVVLVDGEFEIGKHEIEFNASNLPSGVYFYNLTSSTNSITKKMLLLK